MIISLDVILVTVTFQVQSPFNKLMSVFFCICPVTDHKFHHNIVKVAVDPQGDSRVDPQTTLTMLYDEIHCP